jgi:hypothetical protein
MVSRHIAAEGPLPCSLRCLQGGRKKRLKRAGHSRHVGSVRGYRRRAGLSQCSHRRGQALPGSQQRPQLVEQMTIGQHLQRLHGAPHGLLASRQQSGCSKIAQQRQPRGGLPQDVVAYRSPCTTPRACRCATTLATVSATRSSTDALSCRPGAYTSRVQLLKLGGPAKLTKSGGMRGSNKPLSPSG